jgi:hypothetical protein
MIAERRRGGGGKLHCALTLSSLASKLIVCGAANREQKKGNSYFVWWFAFCDFLVVVPEGRLNLGGESPLHAAVPIIAVFWVFWRRSVLTTLGGSFFVLLALYFFSGQTVK